MVNFHRSQRSQPIERIWIEYWRLAGLLRRAELLGVCDICASVHTIVVGGVYKSLVMYNDYTAYVL